MSFCPFNGKDGSFQEFFVCIFFAYVLAMEVFFGQFRHQETMPRKEILFYVTGVIDERLVLYGVNVTSESHVSNTGTTRGVRMPRKI